MPFGKFEAHVSKVMQDLLYDFVYDPNSLRSKGWPFHNTSSNGVGKIGRIGCQGDGLESVNGNQVAGVLSLAGVYFRYCALPVNDS